MCTIHIILTHTTHMYTLHDCNKHPHNTKGTFSLGMQGSSQDLFIAGGKGQCSSMNPWLQSQLVNDFCTKLFIRILYYSNINNEYSYNNLHVDKIFT